MGSDRTTYQVQMCLARYDVEESLQVVTHNQRVRLMKVRKPNTGVKRYLWGIANKKTV